MKTKLDEVDQVLDEKEQELQVLNDDLELAKTQCVDKEEELGEKGIN